MYTIYSVCKASWHVIVVQKKRNRLCGCFLVLLLASLLGCTQFFRFVKPHGTLLRSKEKELIVVSRSSAHSGGSFCLKGTNDWLWSCTHLLEVNTITYCGSSTASDARCFAFHRDEHDCMWKLWSLCSFPWTSLESNNQAQHFDCVGAQQVRLLGKVIPVVSIQVVQTCFYKKIISNSLFRSNIQ
jgi:hypothetical protein